MFVSTRHPRRTGRSQWAVLAFLAGFVVVLLVVVYDYLIPAMDAAKGATPPERHRLAAYSALLLVVVLFVLGSMLIMTFKIGRFFFPRPSGPRVKTKYVDAWAEAGKRFEEKPKE